MESIKWTTEKKVISIIIHRYLGSRGTKSEGGYQEIHPLRVDICPMIFLVTRMHDKVNKVSLLSVFIFFNNVKWKH